MHFSTKAIHSGQQPDPHTGAVIPPIYQTSTFAQEAPAVHKGYEYTRSENPNFTNFEQLMADLEQGEHATVFSSGLGATTAIISQLQSGDHVVMSNDVYGGTFRIFHQVFNRFGVTFSQIDTGDLEVVEEALKKKPAMIFIESPTNPLLRITDIAAVSKLARTYGVRSIVDNTFASPALQNPLVLGADVVLHSTTKYIGGHSDVVGGVVITNDADVKNKMDFARRALGLNPSPFDVWLAHRGAKTLPIRMERHCCNALQLADWLETHPKVSKVYYPGLSNHAGHKIAAIQMSDFGGMVSVEFDLTLEQSKKLISSLSIFTLAESLGGVESLVDHPASMTHASIPKEEREQSGLKDGLVRFSVGIENVADLQADVEGVLEKI